MILFSPRSSSQSQPGNGKLKHNLVVISRAGSTDSAKIGPRLSIISERSNPNSQGENFVRMRIFNNA